MIKKTVFLLLVFCIIGFVFANCSCKSSDPQMWYNRFYTEDGIERFNAARKCAEMDKMELKDWLENKALQGNLFAIMTVFTSEVKVDKTIIPILVSYLDKNISMAYSAEETKWLVIKKKVTVATTSTYQETSYNALSILIPNITFGYNKASWEKWWQDNKDYFYYQGNEFKVDEDAKAKKTPIKPDTGMVMTPDELIKWRNDCNRVEEIIKSRQPKEQ